MDDGQNLQLYPSAVAAARAMPPLSGEAIADIARILADIEGRRAQKRPPHSPGNAAASASPHAA